MADVTMKETADPRDLAATLEERAHHALRDPFSRARVASVKLACRMAALRKAAIQNHRLLRWLEAVIAFAIVALLFLWTDALKAILWVPFSILK